MDVRRVLVILNPASGQHEAEDSRCTIEELLRERGIAFDMCETRAEGDAFRWARDTNPAEHNAIIAAGGDGTIVETMNGLLSVNSDVPLLPVPLGTANGLARALKLPLTTKGALESALDGDTARLDVVHVVNRNHHFLLFAGAGYDAKVIREADREQKDKHGFMAYIYAALKLLKKQRNQRITLYLDGQRLDVFAHTVLLFNASSFDIAGIPVGPKADARDGLLEVVLLRDPTRWGLLRELWNLLTHRLNPKQNQFLQASSVKIETARPLPFQSDGDVLGETPVEIEIKPKAVTFVVPQAYLEEETKSAAFPKGLEEPVWTTPRP
jgi:diacylglycerol kinase (ATP)